MLASLVVPKARLWGLLQDPLPRRSAYWPDPVHKRARRTGRDSTALVRDTERVKTAPHHYAVASGIVVAEDRLLLVQNRRRNGSLDWSTPGGVVDPGEQVLEALTREVVEETGLSVKSWSSLHYVVDARFTSRSITMHAEVFVARDFSGRLDINDPDDIVVDARWVPLDQATSILVDSPVWVRDPLCHALGTLFAGEPEMPALWDYQIGRADGQTDITLLSSPL